MLTSIFMRHWWLLMKIFFLPSPTVLVSTQGQVFEISQPFAENIYFYSELVQLPKILCLLSFQYRKLCFVAALGLFNVFSILACPVSVSICTFWSFQGLLDISLFLFLELHNMQEKLLLCVYEVNIVYVNVRRQSCYKG